MAVRLSALRQIALHLVTDDYGPRARGVYVDSASLETGEMTLSGAEDFESGLGDWSVECGGFGWGPPSAENGPTAQREMVFGTNLAGNYGINQDSRLVTPELLIASDANNPRVRFAYWHALDAGDSGRLELSVDGEPWQELPDTQVLGNSGGWAPLTVALRDYKGHRVRVAIRMQTDDYGPRAPGIYVDDASFTPN